MNQNNSKLHKPKFKISMIKAHKLLETALTNADLILKSPNINENISKILLQIMSNGRELLNHIKSYVKNDISLLLASGRKSKIRDKKKIMSIFNKKTEMLLNSIASIQVQFIHQSSPQQTETIIIDDIKQ